MQETWSELELDMVTYKNGIYKLRSTEEAFWSWPSKTTR